MTNMPQTASKYYISQTRYLFHCHIKIKIPLTCNEHLLDECFSIMEDIDIRYNSYQSGSFFDLINKNAGYWVDVDDTTIWLLNKLRKASDATNGHYDITSMPLLKVWGFYKQDIDLVPSNEDIHDALQKVDYRNIQIEGSQVKINMGQEIITGSFIKAYAVDCAIKHLISNKITDALINAGGSTFATINNDMHKEWFINLPHPHIQGQTFARLPLSNGSFSMSANLSNYIQINGKKYGHIIDSITGWPVENSQVGIVSESALDTDILATALFCTPQYELNHTIQELHFAFQFTCYHISADTQLNDFGFKLNTTSL